MFPPLDIFRVAPDGKLIWTAAADTLQTAQRRIRILMASQHSDYVIYNQETGDKTVVRDNPEDKIENDKSPPSHSD
jgi:hypothetical protein